MSASNNGNDKSQPDDRDETAKQISETTLEMTGDPVRALQAGRHWEN